MKDLTVLGIDTSGKTASCAILRDGVLLGETTLYTKLTHSQVTLPLVQKLIDDCGLTLDDIDLVAVSDGPGSYTGLRIGISAVKGICFSGKIQAVKVITFTVCRILRGIQIFRF